MKLRNKKTGEYGNYKIISAGNLIRVIDSKSCDSWQYDSLAGFYEKWEDYNPAEPLIKDEKIRNAVRAWAEALGVTKVYVCGIGDGREYMELYAQDNDVTDGRMRISIPTQDDMWIEKEYAVSEICGEEE